MNNIIINNTMLVIIKTILTDLMIKYRITELCILLIIICNLYLYQENRYLINKDRILMNKIQTLSYNTDHIKSFKNRLYNIKTNTIKVLEVNNCISNDLRSFAQLSR